MGGVWGFVSFVVKAGRTGLISVASNRLCLTSSLGRHIAAFATALLKSAATCVFWEATLTTTTALHATSATTGVSSAAWERGVTTTISGWPRAAFFYSYLFRADGMRVGSHCSIVSSSICKFHEGAVLTMSASSLGIWNEITYPLPCNIKVFQFAVFLELGPKLTCLNLFIHILDVSKCV